MTASAPSSRGVRSGAWIEGVTLALCALVVLAFVGLIPLGQWYDEYFTIGHIRDDGLPFVVDRLRGWSPRPLSELLVYLYARAVVVSNRPLVTPALVLMWLPVAAAAIGPTLRARRAVLPSAVLGCLLLAGHQVAELFYWPIAAFAYLPTLAAILLLLTLDWAGAEGRGWALVALLVAALTSEVGAMFCAVYCILAGLGGAVARDWRPIRSLLPPFLVAIVVLYYLSQGRVSHGQEVLGDPAIAHHPIPALILALRLFAVQVVGTDSTDVLSWPALLVTLSKLLLFCGIYLVVPLGPADRTLARQMRRCALALSLVGVTFLTLWAAFQQFGLPCCQRHGTIRQEFVFIAIAVLATALAAWKRSLPRPAAGAAVLLAAVALPLVVTAPRLVADYRDYSRFMAVRAALWRSGRDGTPTLVVPQTDPGQIVGGVRIAAGNYLPEEHAMDTFARPMIAFFHKTQSRFEDPVPN